MKCYKALSVEQPLPGPVAPHGVMSWQKVRIAASSPSIAGNQSPPSVPVLCRHDECRERHHPSPMGQPDLTGLSKPPEYSLSPALPLLPQWDHFPVFALQELLCCVGFAQCSGQIIAALLCSPRCPWGFSSLLWVMLLAPGSLQKR